MSKPTADELQRQIDSEHRHIANQSECDQRYARKWVERAAITIAYGLLGLLIAALFQGIVK